MCVYIIRTRAWGKGLRGEVAFIGFIEIIGAIEAIETMETIEAIDYIEGIVCLKPRSAPVSSPCSSPASLLFRPGWQSG